MNYFVFGNETKAKGVNFLHTHWTLMKVGGGGGVLYGAFLILINYAGGMSS
jgi:hypothetical protein